MGKLFSGIETSELLNCIAPPILAAVATDPFAVPLLPFEVESFNERVDPVPAEK